MAHLIYSAISSLDGYIEDRDGNFDWAAPDEEVHRFINNLERTADTYLYGRRMYETMMVWETDPNLALIPHSRKTLQRYGKQPTKSCTPGRWRLYPLAKRSLSKRSIRKRFDN
jgi:dihydrofolate reductase